MSARFSSVLIANRGEIACRIIRAAREEGLSAIAVFSDADAAALHVRLADKAIRIGPSPPGGSYLSIGALIDAAKATGAEALHPGYGFLAENADLAEACAAARARVRRTAVGRHPRHGRQERGQGADGGGRRALRPGLSWAGPVTCTLRRRGRAHRLSRDGQGERGRRRPRHAHRARARGAGGRFAGGPRQGGKRLRRRPPADRAGAADCAPCRSAGVRRRAGRDRPSRRARLLDPAPPSEGDRGGALAAVSPALREAMGAAAVKAAAAVGYVGAGTVEFLLDRTPTGDGLFYFLEMNTRIQVEHPVTECVTGVDLVRLQFRVARLGGRCLSPRPISRSRATRSRRGFARRTRQPTSCRRSERSPRGGRPRARACGSTRASKRARR